MPITKLPNFNTEVSQPRPWQWMHSLAAECLFPVSRIVFLNHFMFPVLPLLNTTWALPYSDHLLLLWIPFHVLEF